LHAIVFAFIITREDCFAIFNERFRSDKETTVCFASQNALLRCNHNEPAAVYAGIENGGGWHGSDAEKTFASHKNAP
jgi:hypothetical protein